MSARYYPTLDGWRAIAVAGVMLAHYGTIDPRFAITANPTAMGVDLFFAISGFLITRGLMEQWGEPTGRALRSFYIRRVCRILPPLYLYVIVAGALALAGIVSLRLSSWVAAATFTRSYVDLTNLGDGMGHTWSLAVEEHFYLLWPCACLFARRRGTALRVALFGIAGIDAWRWFLAGPAAPHWLRIGTAYRTDTRLDAILWGCVIALLLERLQDWHWPAAGWTAVAVVGAVGAISAHYVGYVFNYRFTNAAAPAAVAMSFPLLIAGTVLAPGTLGARALESAWLRWVGRLSYSLYLWQQLFLFKSPQESSAVMHMLQSEPLGLVLIFACAAASYYLVEGPCRRWGRRRAAGSAQRRAAVA